jgi:hypothetical protein
MSDIDAEIALVQKQLDGVSGSSTIGRWTYPRRALISILSIVALITLFRPVWLCKLEYDHEKGKTRASLLFTKTFITALAGSLILFAVMCYFRKF